MAKAKIATGLALAAGIAGAWLGRRHLIARAVGLPAPRYAVGVERGIEMRLPDGVTLVADHYYPKAAGDFPTLLRRTPYGRNGNVGLLGLLDDARAHILAERGYHVVTQDVRGRGESDGQFNRFEDEAADGKSTLEWVSQQPWFNGTLGLWGESYNGFTQWAVTQDAPAYLKALMPCITSSTGYSYAYTASGSFALLGLLEWTKLIENSQGATPWYRTKLDRLDPAMAYNDPAFNHLPLNETDEVALGYAVPFYRKWLDHPYPTDNYWQTMNFRASLPQLAAPAHLVSGWYDLFLYDLLLDYAVLRDAGRNPYLTIGPWTHGVMPVLESLRQAIPWFETYLKGASGQLRDKPVRYFVMGANEWREADDWPPPSRQTRYYLHESRKLDTNEPQAHSSPDVYRYNPADPTPALGGSLLNPPNGAVDNQSLEVRPDVLTYTTVPLGADTEVIGAVTAELYVHSSLDYTDFFLRLCDVYPDGRSLNVCDGLIRVTPGVGEVQADGSLRIEVDMIATAYRFKAGHRIRLQVSSGAHPRFSRNLGTGEPLATGTQMQIATQTICHDQAHPSALVLPLPIV